VFVDKFISKSLLDSRPFMASSMALASGVLLFSSLAILFPQAQSKLNNDALLYTCYFGGATFTLVLTRIIHNLMPDAIHACGNASEDCHHSEENNHHSHQHREERRKLNDHPCDVEYGTIRSSETHFRFHHDDHVHNPTVNHEEENDIRSDSPSTQQHNRHESVEETVTKDPGHYYSIGIQTAVAICVHKFPGK
jgi:zinc transporter ZupT